MKRFLIIVFATGMLLTLCACGNKTGNEKAAGGDSDNLDIDVEFSDVYLVGDAGGASGWECVDYWQKLPLEYRIRYDGTVELYMPRVSDYEIKADELIGTYELTDEEIEYLIKNINLKKLYNLDPEEQHEIMDGDGRFLTVYDKDGDVLKRCGGYMPGNSSFMSMYKAVRDTLHLQEHARFREEWINEQKAGLFESFLDNKIEAFDTNNGYAGIYYCYISNPEDGEEWSAIRFNEENAYADIDNDGEMELTLWGPYGGFFVDEADGSLNVLAYGSDTANVLNYTMHEDEAWLVYADTSHAGRAMRHFVKYEEGWPADEFDLNAEYWEAENDRYDETSTFTYRGEPITMEEYENLLAEYGIEVVSSNDNEIAGKYDVDTVLAILGKGYEAPYRCELDSIDDNGAYLIHIYELVDNGDESHTATVDWITVDPATGECENFFGETFNIADKMN